VRLLSILLLCLFLTAVAQPAALTNDSVVKMVKAQLGEDLIVTTIRSQLCIFQLGADDLIALKQAGVSDKVIAAMVEKSNLDTTAGAVAQPVAGAPAAPPVSEVGVYYQKAGEWADLPPEVVNFKTGGVLKSIGTIGVVKGDINGHLNGGHSHTALKSPVELLVYVQEGVAITEYQLLRLREEKDSREFRTVTGGVMHVSGGATRDLVPFESKKTAPRTYQIVLPNLGEGEYGLLPPAGADPTAATGRIGKIYSFRLIE